MLVCAGGRLALRASTSRALARATLPPVVFQYLRGQLPPRQGLLNARNYWWSKPAAQEVANPTPSPPRETVAALPDTPSVQPEPIDPSTIPAPDVSQVLPPDVSPTISEAVTNIIPPLQYGDFAALGLTGWSPSGIMRWSFEWLQVTTGMPWFYTIIAGTLFWRAILIPSSLTAMRNAARLRPYSAQIQALDEQTKATKDRAAQMEIMLKKQKLIEKAGVSIGSSLLLPVIQVIGNFGLFFAVKGMVQLPVAQLTQSGVSFLPDLTVTGDYIMPTLMVLAMNVQFWIASKEADPTNIRMAHTWNIVRVASFVSLPMMAALPTGLWLSAVSGLLLSITQSSLLRVPRIRHALQIAPLTPTPPVTMKDTGKAILAWYREKRTEVVAKQVVDQRKPNWTTLPKAARRTR